MTMVSRLPYTPTGSVAAKSPKILPPHRPVDECLSGAAAISMAGFGLLTRLDPTGRAVAATPAMLMIGAAVGPVLGGSAVKLAGYSALSVMVACIGVGAAILFLGARRRVVLAEALPA